MDGDKEKEGSAVWSGRLDVTKEVGDWRVEGDGGFRLVQLRGKGAIY